ncbi:MAG: phosphatidate cytidylyltransferase [Actinobacteria bacterium]|nr:phosphatidate cytidylyltransferase [Actinomycetota bacterium]
MAERRARRGSREDSSVAERVIGAVLFAIIFLGTLIWGKLPFTIAIALAAALGSIELFSLFETKGEAVPTAAVLGILGSVAYVFMAYFKGFASYGYVTIALVFLSFIWYMVVLRHVKPTKAVALTVLAPILSGLCLSHLVLLRELPIRKSWLIVIFLMALIWVYDILAWLIGRKLGRHKIAPSVSPNKSLEGAIAGTVGVIAASILFRLIVVSIEEYRWFSIGVALVIAAIVVVLGPLGDLSESLVKRDYGVKNMGSLIPGHGGIMDRLDSTLFTAPAVFYYLLYFVIKFK